MGTPEFLLAIIVFTLLGCLAGIITGLVPGVHVNTVAYMVLASQAALIALAMAFFGWASPTSSQLIVIVCALVIGNVITHTFLDFIPSVFLGAPEGETALSLLPGHRMMLEGRGFEAVKCSVIGSFGAVLGALILLIPMRLIIGSPIHAYDAVAPWMHLLLIGIAIFLILTETARPSDKFVKYKEFKMDGHVLITNMAPEKIAHDGQQIISLGELQSSVGGEAVIQSEVWNILVEGDDRYMILKEGGRSLQVKMTGTLPIMPEVGDMVVVVGKIVPLPSFQDHMKKRMMATGVFFLAGLLGISLLSVPGLASQNLFLIKIPSVDSSTVLLFPLFTGLFGLSTLILSMMDAPTIPEQKIENVRVKLTLRQQAKGIVSGCGASAASWFPGVSAAISTIISLFLHKGSDDLEGEDGETETQQFLVSVSAVNTSVALFNLMALFVILKSRSGAMKAVEGIMAADLTAWEPLGNVPMALSALLLSALIASILSIFLALFFGKLFARYCSKLNYIKLVKGVLIFLVIMVFMFSGVLGLVILAISTCVGMIPPLIGVKRVHLMGCLIIPVILFFL